MLTGKNYVAFNYVQKLTVHVQAGKSKKNCAIITLRKSEYKRRKEQF